MHKSIFSKAFAIVMVSVLCGVSANAIDGKQNDDFAGKVRLVLPPVLYAVPGKEVNVYFDNVVLVVNSANYVFDVNCAKGSQFAQRWTYIPAKSDSGDYPFVLEVRDETNAIIARGRSVIHVVPVNAGSGRQITCLMMGDSLTHAGIYPKRVWDLCREPNNPQLTMTGSRTIGSIDAGNNPVKFEGYGGWTAERFATHFTGIAHKGDYRKLGSPFIYTDDNNQPKLNFTRYCKEFNDGKGPDFVTILLGCNDVFNSNDDNIEANIDNMFKNYDALIAAIHSLSKDTVIGAVLPVPPAASQDAFGANYQCGQTRWQYKRNQHRLVERMIAKYSSGQISNVFVVPAYTNIDCEKNFPKDAKTVLLNNGVHPAPAGYDQIGDTIYYWLKARVSEIN